MTADRWAFLCGYVRELFGGQDPHLERLMPEAVAAGLPDISIGPEVGRLLMILASLTAGRLAIEVGTLGGYSGIWIARGLAAGGRLITIEKEPAHADFATRQFERAGVADRVEVRRGAALDVLPALAREIGPAAADLVFLDAVKTEYAEYWSILRPLVAPGGLVVADNAFGGEWWIGDAADPRARGMDRFNRLLAADADFDAVAVPLRSGVVVGRRKG